jgi:ABC-type uncharacterized transport system permease subunit
MKIFLVIAITLAIVGAAYYWREALDSAFPWLKGWRTVVLNAIPAIGIMATDVIGFLAGFSWGQLVSAETAALLMLTFNIANIALRFTTTTPVGEK